MVQLQYQISDIAPEIDNSTMFIHYYNGYGGAINNTNIALASVNNSVIPPPSRNNLTRAIPRPQAP